MRLYPLKFQPIFQERIWGGRKIESLYGKKLPPGLIGESWEISDRPDAVSVIRNGPLAGKDLRWVMEEHRSELMGAAQDAEGRFPLLIKILDAREKLSLQVHPPASRARQLGGDPKTEMWFITEADPGAELFVGLKRGVTREEFERKLREGQVADCFHRLPVAAGDAMFLPSGRVHAIGGGLVIFEIQQNSDTTYRVFDWNRVDGSGKARPLHIRESLESIDFNDFEPRKVAAPFTALDNMRVKQLVSDPLFTVELAEGAPESQLILNGEAPAMIAAVSGKVAIESEAGAETLEPGEFCLVPASHRAAVKTASTATYLIARPGQK